MRAAAIIGGMEFGVTFAVTSCGRFDLLDETLRSFFLHNRAPIAKHVLIEDSGDEGVLDVVRKYEPRFTVLVNNPKLGQLNSIDRAYQTIETPFIFHCEDDWRFLRGGFIEQSLAILKRFPDISGVLSRRLGQVGPHDSIIRTSPLSDLDGIAFRKMNTRKWPPWGGYSFNPSLVRLSDYETVGPFSHYNSERDISDAYMRRHMALACLEEPACETIGDDRHIDDPFVVKNEPKRSFLKTIAGLLGGKP